jgi:hypothetical protein
MKSKKRSPESAREGEMEEASWKMGPIIFKNAILVDRGITE